MREGNIVMKKSVYRISDEEYRILASKYPNMTRSEVNEIEGLLAEKMYADNAFYARTSEIELVKNKALGAMGTDNEMSFSDIERGMLTASLSDGRKALKEIMEKTPVEVPLCSDSTPMKNQGREKKQL